MLCKTTFFSWAQGEYSHALQLRLFLIYCKGVELLLQLLPLLLLLLLLVVARLVIRQQLLMQCGPLCTPRRKIRTTENETRVIWRGSDNTAGEGVRLLARSISGPSDFSQRSHSVDFFRMWCSCIHFTVSCRTVFSCWLWFCCQGFVRLHPTLQTIHNFPFFHIQSCTSMLSDLTWCYLGQTIPHTEQNTHAFMHSDRTHREVVQTIHLASREQT